jgi:hypothetical protein
VAGSWISENHIGDWASVAGVLISIIGFAVTLVSVFKARTAASRAEAAAKSTRDAIRLFDAIVDFSSAITILEQIKRAHRQQEWVLLPDRYAELRKILIAARTKNESLTAEHKTAIQDTITSLRTMESLVERNMQNPGTLKVTKFNGVVSKHIDTLVAVLAELRAADSGEH